MRKALFMALFFICGASLTFGQEEYKKGEFGVMYSNNRVDTGGAFSNDIADNGRDGFHGVNLDTGYNFSRYFGAKADFSYNRKSADLALGGGTGTINLDGNLTQLMGGVKVQDNATETRIRPFAQALFGVGHASVESNSVLGNFDQSDTGFAAAFGGGLDIRVHQNVDIRAIKIEYNPVRIDGETDNNIRLGFGLNFRF